MGISLNADGSATSTDTGLTSSPSGSNTTDNCKDDHRSGSSTDADKFQKELNKSPDESSSGQVEGQGDSNVPGLGHPGTRCSISDLYSSAPITSSEEEPEEEEEAPEKERVTDTLPNSYDWKNGNPHLNRMSRSMSSSHMAEGNVAGGYVTGFVAGSGTVASGIPGPRQDVGRYREFSTEDGFDEVERGTYVTNGVNVAGEALDAGITAGVCVSSEPQGLGGTSLSLNADSLSITKGEGDTVCAAVNLGPGVDLTVSVEHTHLHPDSSDDDNGDVTGDFISTVSH
jgi:hypothetical protein